MNRLEEFKAINKKVKDVDYQEIDGLICVTEKYVKENMESFGVSDVFIEDLAQCAGRICKGSKRKLKPLDKFRISFRGKMDRGFPPL